MTHINEGKIICRLKPGLKVRGFNKNLEPVHRHIISVSKIPRRTPYRLVVRSKQEKIFWTNTYPSISYMVRKPSGEKVIKRIGEIKDEEEFVLYVNGYFRYGTAISFVKDTAKSRFYDIILGKPALVPVDHFMMKFE